MGSSSSKQKLSFTMFRFYDEAGYYSPGDIEITVQKKPSYNKDELLIYIARHLRVDISDIRILIWTDIIAANVREMREDETHECVPANKTRLLVEIAVKQPLRIEFAGQSFAISVFHCQRIIDVIQHYATRNAIVSESLIVEQTMDPSFDVLVAGFCRPRTSSAPKDILALIVRYIIKTRERITNLDLRGTLRGKRVRPGETLIVSLNRDCEFVEYAHIDHDLEIEVFVRDGVGRFGRPRAKLGRPTIESLLKQVEKVPLTIRAIDTVQEVLDKMRQHANLPMFGSRDGDQLHFKNFRLDSKATLHKHIIDWGVVDQSVLDIWFKTNYDV